MNKFQNFNSFRPLKPLREQSFCKMSTATFSAIRKQELTVFRKLYSINRRIFIQSLEIKMNQCFYNIRLCRKQNK